MCGVIGVRGRREEGGGEGGGGGEMDAPTSTAIQTYGENILNEYWWIVLLQTNCVHVNTVT